MDWIGIFSLALSVFVALWATKIALVQNEDFEHTLKEIKELKDLVKLTDAEKLEKRTRLIVSNTVSVTVAPLKGFKDKVKARLKSVYWKFIYFPHKVPSVIIIAKK